LSRREDDVIRLGKRSDRPFAPANVVRAGLRCGLIALMLYQGASTLSAQNTGAAEPPAASGETAGADQFVAARGVSDFRALV
jgi:hypothetical protein